MRWSSVLMDRSLHNRPYKIELNQKGNIEMSPATNKQGFLQKAAVGFFNHRGEQPNSAFGIAQSAWHSLQSLPF